MPLVSVIVPVYNVERYLGECLESILGQTFRDFEVILVDDGSTDKSGSICDEYAEKDARIKVFHQKNQGVSAARNFALSKATGRYVMFVDPDDYWMCNTVLKQLVTVAEANDLDIVRGEYQSVDECGNMVSCYPVVAERLKYSNSIITSYDFLRYAINGEFFLWLSLFRQSAIGGLSFETGRIFLEDMQFLYRLLVKELRCMYLPELRFYAYRRNTGSISSKVSLRKIFDSFEMCNFLHGMLQETDNEKLRKTILTNNIHVYCSTLETLSSRTNRNLLGQVLPRIEIRKVKMAKWPLGCRIDFLTYYLPPMMAIRLYRLKAKLGTVKRFLLHR